MSRRGENIYKRKDGRWEGRYTCGFRSDGKPKYRSVYGHSYQEVKAKLLPLKAKPSVPIPSGSLTFGVLFEEWLSAVRLRVKESTYANYRRKAQKHILPAFGKLHYANLTPDLVHDFIHQKLDTGLSPKYVADIVIVMKSAARYVSRVHGFADPLYNVMLPKTDKHELRILDDRQQKRLCSYLNAHPDHTSLCILLSLHMGLRVGEVCGLKWEDIDFTKSILTVRRTVQRIPAGQGTKLLIDTPKSRSSRRVIPIPAMLVKLLQMNRGEQSHFILSDRETPTEPRTLQHRFKRILQKAGLPSFNYHSLRHLFATNCIRTGFDVKTLSEILGHASVETTLSRYVHSSLERKRACMERIRISA